MRKLSHPRDLRTGDIIKFQYLDQSDISGKEFEVSQINTYIYDDELCYPELVLKDRSGGLLYLMVEEEDGEESLAITKKISKARVYDVLSAKDMEAVLKGGLGVKINIASKPENLEEWLVGDYTKIADSVQGEFVKGDARHLSFEALEKRESFSSYTLEDDDGDYALEIEVYGTGETELGVTVYHDIGEIEEMWPASGTSVS